ncbi:MAG: methylated-DNA--[protein]-cysteine S-methyltransferase [Planctomycetaceae bacterium]
MAALTKLEFPAVINQSPHGWYGVAGDERAVSFVTIGHHSAREALQCLERAQGSEHWVLSSIVRDAADEIARYLDGEPVNLNRIPVHPAGRTPFQQRVVTALRRVPYGTAVSYAELADLAGAPSAARAVGTVMSRNRVPLLIPCHRVVGSGGQLGGFSAPTGIALKRALLDMESEAHVAVHS